METLKFKCLIFVCLTFSFLNFKASAQTDDITTLRKQVHDCLWSNLQFSAFKDSVAIYGFAFKIELNNVNGKTVVTSVAVNDAFAEKIFPHYQMLKEVDYSAISLGKTKTTLILPVCLILKGKHRYDEELIVPIANIPDNILKIFYFDRNAQSTLTNYIYLTPMVSTLNNTVYH